MCKIFCHTLRIRSVVIDIKALSVKLIDRSRICYLTRSYLNYLIHTEAGCIKRKASLSDLNICYLLFLTIVLYVKEPDILIRRYSRISYLNLDWKLFGRLVFLLTDLDGYIICCKCYIFLRSFFILRNLVI